MIATRTRTGLTVHVSDASVAFGGVHALEGVNFRAAAGSVHALIGPNGAGKTTLLNCISRFVSLDSGRVTIGDEDVTRLPAHRLVSLGVARSFQHPVLIDEMSVLENVEFGLYRRYSTTLADDLFATRRSGRQRRLRRDRAREALAEIGLSDRADMKVKSLSFGNRKLVDFARAWSAHAGVILLDEPTAGLDARNVARLIDLLNSASGDRVVVVVEHHMEFVAAVADRVTVLASGRVIADGDPTSVRRLPVVVEAYTGLSAT